MENKDKYQVYKGGDSIDNFNFYRVPKKLFDMEYISLPVEAKLLYAIMLDRTSLSIKNQWLDEHDQVYIYFTIEDVCRYIRVSKTTAIRLMELLNDTKGYGLIHREHQGLGKPDKIYVKNIMNRDCEVYCYDHVDNFVEYMRE